jgi:hypothetical protein
MLTNQTLASKSLSRSFALLVTQADHSLEHSLGYSYFWFMPIPERAMSTAPLTNRRTF